MDQGNNPFWVRSEARSKASIRRGSALTESTSQSNNNQSERVFGSLAKLAGWTLRSKAVAYNRWFFRKLLKPLELELLEQYVSHLTHGVEGTDPWQTSISLQQLASYIGTTNNLLTEPFGRLQRLEIKCPICNKVLRPGMSNGTEKEDWPNDGQGFGLIDITNLPCHKFQVDLTPFRDVLIHLQQHHENDKENYERKKQEWLESRKLAGRVEGGHQTWEGNFIDKGDF